MENMIGQLKGEVRFDWGDQGLTCEIALPLAYAGQPKVVRIVAGPSRVLPTRT